MKPSTATVRRGLVAAAIAAALPAASAVFPVPSATGSSDPCAASEVARAVGSVSKAEGDYLDNHPATNQAITSTLQQQMGPQSLATLKSHFEANPKVVDDLEAISQPLNSLFSKCRLSIKLPDALGLTQAAQGTGGLPGSPAATPPLGGVQGTPPAGMGPVR